MLIYKKELKRKKSEEYKTSKLNIKNLKRPKFLNINYTQNSEKLKQSPNKTTINCIKESNIISKTTKGKNIFFKKYFGNKQKDESKNSLKNDKNINNNKENNEIDKNKDEKEKENYKKILLNKLFDSQKKELLYNYKNSIKYNTLKDDIQNKIEILHSKGCNMDELSSSIDTLFIKEKHKKKNINLIKERSIKKEIMIKRKEANKKQNKIDNYRLYNESKRLFNSYSNVNIMHNNKRKKSTINEIKSKIDTFEFIKKIQKKLSNNKKIIFTSNIDDNSKKENLNNYEHSNIKGIITDYIKIKIKERKKRK